MVAHRLHMAAPSPLPNTMGAMPATLVSVVIITGRSRERPPLTIARRSAGRARAEG